MEGAHEKVRMKKVVRGSEEGGRMEDMRRRHQKWDK